MQAFGRGGTGCRRALAALVMASAFMPQGVQAGALSRLDGVWSGQGSLSTLTGLEHARCGAAYRARAETIALDLRCTTESYGLLLASEIRESHGTVTGTWTERRFGTSGLVSGRLVGDRLSLSTTVVGAQLSIAITMAPRRQAITLRTTSPLFPGGSLLLVRE